MEALNDAGRYLAVKVKMALGKSDSVSEIE